MSRLDLDIGAERSFEKRTPVLRETQKELDQLKRELLAVRTREALRSELGETEVPPESALFGGSSVDDDGSSAWFPEWDMGAAASAACSCDFGTAKVIAVYLDFGGA